MTDLTDKDMICPETGEDHDLYAQNVAPDIEIDGTNISFSQSLKCNSCGKCFEGSGQLGLFKGNDSWGGKSGWDDD